MSPKEERVELPFHLDDADGNEVYRDSLIFATVQEFRNTSQAERQAMMQERYDNYLAVINAPSDVPPPEGS